MRTLVAGECGLTVGSLRTFIYQGSVKEAIEIVKCLRLAVWPQTSPSSHMTRDGARGLSLSFHLL
jgi:hypothetical protein